VITASLQFDSVHWNALSYQWGQDEATIPITVDRQSFLVRPNLYAFLKRMAEDEDENTRPIFIDAVCINQSDFDERSTLVLLMGEIYKRAVKVIVWIIPSGYVVRELQRLALSYLAKRLEIGSDDGRPLEQLGHRQKEAFKLSKAAEASDFLAFEFQPTMPGGVEWILKIEETRYSEPVFRSHGEAIFESGAAFIELQKCIVFIIAMDSYWTRLWIIQEVLLAKELEFWFLTWKWPERNLSRPFDPRKLEVVVENSLKSWTLWTNPDFGSQLLSDSIVTRTGLDQNLQFTQKLFPRQNLKREAVAGRFLAFCNLRREYQDQAEGVHLDFSQALAISHYAQCHRIEDKVLGILGITRMHRVPQYGTSQQDLFIDIVANYVASVRPWEAWLDRLAIADEKWHPQLRGQVAVMFAFEIPVAHAWVTLVFSLALSIFGYHPQIATRLTILYEKMYIKAEYADARNVFSRLMKWHYSRGGALQKAAAARGEEKMRRLMQIKDEDGWIWCPLPTPRGGDARHGESYSDWVNLIRERMMPVWHYYQEQNGKPHEVEPTLDACWPTKGYFPRPRGWRDNFVMKR
jgi:hypothetical protein